MQADSILVVLEFFSREILVFVAVCFAVSSIDDLAVDLVWLGLAARSRRGSGSTEKWRSCPPAHRVAVLVPAWHEAEILPLTLQRMLDVWNGQNFCIYVGCYANDPDTLSVAQEIARSNSNVRVAVCSSFGPTSKADALNHCWQLLQDDIEASGVSPGCVLLQDAEDIVHRDVLGLVDAATTSHDFVQLPVVPLRERSHRWIAGHYADEFAEQHGKQLVVRAALGAALPAAGVGCAFRFASLKALVVDGGLGPFDTATLTEDYELGIRLSQGPKGAAFLRYRDGDGQLIATQEFFPTGLGAAIRQKSRWMIGISLAGWDRLGWSDQWADNWMRIRDRKASFSALVLFLAYFGILLWFTLLFCEIMGWHRQQPLPSWLEGLLWLNLGFLIWRLLMRVLFSARLYGFAEAILSIPRLLVGNLVNILAGRRAGWLYIKSLFGAGLAWEKTHHRPGRLDVHVPPQAARPDSRR